MGDTMYLFISKFILYNLRIYKIALVTVNMFRVATNGDSDAAATAALAEENSRLQLGTATRVFQVWLRSLIV